MWCVVQGALDIPKASLCGKDCLQHSCRYPSGWCTIFGFLGCGFCGADNTRNGGCVRDAECEVGNCLALILKIRNLSF